MGESAISVPIKTRTHELAQLQEYLPKIARHLDSIDHDDADTIRQIHDTHLSPIHVTRPEDGVAAHVSMPSDDWQLVVRHLRRVNDGLRPLWLQKKLVKRLRQRIDEIE